MTPTEFLTSDEYRHATESARYIYDERIAILMEDRPSDKPDYFVHEIALREFREAVRNEKA